MPSRLFVSVFMQVYAEKWETTFYHCSAEIMENTVESVAKLFGVSKLSAKIRAIQLGITKAEGVCHADTVRPPKLPFVPDILTFPSRIKYNYMVFTHLHRRHRGICMNGFPNS